MRGSVVGWGLPAHSAPPWATWVLDRAHRGLKPALAGPTKPPSRPWTYLSHVTVTQNQPQVPNGS